MLVSGERGVGKTELTKKLLKSKLIAPPPKCIVWCYAQHQQDLFEELMKMNVEYVEGISGELDKYFKKNKRNLIILDGLMDEGSKSLKILNCLPVLVISIFPLSISHKICSIKINALLV